MSNAHTHATRKFTFTDETGTEHQVAAGSDVSANPEGKKRLDDFRHAGLLGPKAVEDGAKK